MTHFIAEWMVRSSVLIAIGALVLGALRVNSASVKLAAWTAMLLASLSIPFLMMVLPALPLRVLPAQASSSVLSTAPLALSAATPIASQPSQAISAAAPFDSWRLAVICYLTIAGVLLARLFLGLLMAHRLVRTSRPAGLNRAGIQVRESESLSSPVTIGISRALILLPSDWREWSQAKVDAVLAHEAAHVRRRDPLVQALSAVHRALLWANPLSWVLHRQLVRLAEEASDEAAVAATQDRCGYAEVLLGFMQRGMSHAHWHGVAMARYERPEVRINRILHAPGSAFGVTRKALILIVVLAAPAAYLLAVAHADAAPVAPAAGSAAPSVVAVPGLPHSPAQSATPPAKAVPKQSARPSSGPAAAAPSSSAQAATSTESSASIQRYLVIDDSSMSGSWNSRDTDVEKLREKFGRHFAWFRQNGNEFVITDAGVLEEFRKANGPQEEVNKMQANVNAHQAEVNGMQSQVNAMQSKVNDLQNQVNARQDIANRIQSSVNQDDKEALIKKLQQAEQDVRSGRADADQSTVNREQAKVNEAQHAVNAKQAEVNALQQDVNKEQQRVNVEYRRRMQEIFDSAIKRGLAQQII